MIVLDVQQGSAEWLQARLGIPTASRFSSIMTPKTRKPSAQQDKYLCQLLAERLLGHPVDEVSTDFMERGTMLEPQAVAAYEFLHDVATEPVGFMLSDDRRYGASPDRLVGANGALEVKCLSAANHVAAMLGWNNEDHISQVQGQLWVSGLAWVDNFFFNPELPSHEVRIYRDEVYIAALSGCVLPFCNRLEAAYAQLTGGTPPAGAHPIPGMEAGAEVSVTTRESDIERARRKRDHQPTS
jgi:hypothetical protein